MRPGVSRVKEHPHPLPGEERLEQDNLLVFCLIVKTRLGFQVSTISAGSMPWPALDNRCLLLEEEQLAHHSPQLMVLQRLMSELYPGPSDADREEREEGDM